MTRLRLLCIGWFLSFTASPLLAPELAENNSDYSGHLTELHKRVPAGFTIVLQEPFVVIGDENPATVRRRSTNADK